MRNVVNTLVAVQLPPSAWVAVQLPPSAWVAVQLPPLAWVAVQLPPSAWVAVQVHAPLRESSCYIVLRYFLEH
jgi:hypothetical protein